MEAELENFGTTNLTNLTNQAKPMISPHTLSAISASSAFRFLIFFKIRQIRGAFHLLFIDKLAHIRLCKFTNSCGRQPPESNFTGHYAKKYSRRKSRIFHELAILRPQKRDEIVVLCGWGVLVSKGSAPMILGFAEFQADAFS